MLKCGLKILKLNPYSIGTHPAIEANAASATVVDDWKSRGVCTERTDEILKKWHNLSGCGSSKAMKFSIRHQVDALVSSI